jgi:hypothetical protein
VRPPRIVAGAAVIVALAMVAVPGSIGSASSPRQAEPVDASRFREVDAASLSRATVATIPQLDPAYRSDGQLGLSDSLVEPMDPPAVPDRTSVDQPESRAHAILVNPWRYDPEISFYGPGFYGKRTACGLAYTTSIMGVAHRTLPCGTMVRFRNPYNGAEIALPVIDRGPYIAGRTWDLSGAACRALGHCWTGPIYWKWG